MYRFIKSRNYIIIKNINELKNAMNVDICRFIIMEENNIMNIWIRLNGKWNRERYALLGEIKEKDLEVTGSKAYQSFYKYCGKEEVEKMKHILNPIPIWESCEQMHFANYEFAEKKLYQPIFEYDANSAFTYGALQLPDGFDLLKEYMLNLYDKKKNAPNKISRSRYKNMQNFLIGYFSRIKDFVRVRSDIIEKSNKNIKNKMLEIIKNKGTVYLSNTDSIITDSIGAEIMEKYKGDNVGQFKLEKVSNKLCYKSPNSYQIGDEIIYSGVPYFARKHTDLFMDLSAKQEGSLIKGFDFVIDAEDNFSKKVCRVEYGEIIVKQYNLLGELINTYSYKVKE